MEDFQKELADFQNMLMEFYTDNPINWFKWAVVYFVLIVGYIWWIPRYNKISYRFSWERKRDIAISRKHIIKATRVGAYRTGESRDDWHAKYSYTIDGEEKIYRAFFTSPSIPPRIVNLYYLENPKKLFCYGEYHWEIPKGIVLVFLMFVPWYLAGIAFFALGIPIPETIAQNYST